MKPSENIESQTSMSNFSPSKTSSVYQASLGLPQKDQIFQIEPATKQILPPRSTQVAATAII